MSEDKPFKLPVCLKDTGYEMPGNLKKIAQWRAPIQCDNSGSKDKNRDGEVGYLLISLDTNDLIPVSRADEHHHGYDMLHSLEKRHHVLAKLNFLSFWSRGKNYLYDRKEIPELLAAAKKFIAYGGDPHHLIVGSNEHQGSISTVEAFISSGGVIEPAPYTLAPIGARLLESLDTASKAVLAAIADPSEKKEKAAFAAASATLKMVSAAPCSVYFDIGEKFSPMLRTLRKLHDIVGLDKMLFSYGGVANGIHQTIRDRIDRAASGNKNYFVDDDIKGIWGDLALANDKLGRR